MLPSCFDSWRLIILRARLHCQAANFSHICCISSEGLWLWNDLRGNVEAFVGLSVRTTCERHKGRKKKTRARLVIGWFMCQVSPISSVVSHPFPSCKQLLPLNLASQLHCRHTHKRFARGATSTGRKRKALVPCSSGCVQKKKMCWPPCTVWQHMRVLFCFFFVSAAKSRNELIC